MLYQKSQSLYPARETGWWLLGILLFSMLPEGLAISIAGRTPTVTFLDVLLPVVSLYILARNCLGPPYFGFADKKIFLLGWGILFVNLLSLLGNLRDIPRGVFALKVFAFGLIIYWILLATISTERGLERAASILVVWGGVLGLLLAYQFFSDWSSVFGPVASYDAKQEIGLSMGKSNYLAAILVPILPVGLALSVSRKGSQRTGLLLAAGAMSLGLLITMSKGALLSLILGSLVSAPLLLKAGLKLKHLFLILIAMGLSAAVLPRDLLLANYDMFAYRIDNPDVGRLQLWILSWKVFLQNPLLGVGPGAIYLYNQRIGIDELYSHNSLLNMFSELGLAGGFPFLLLLGNFLRRSYRLCTSTISQGSRKYLPLGFFIGLVSTLLHGMVEPTFQGQQYTVVFWAIVALVHLHGEALLKYSAPGQTVLTLGSA